MWERYVLQLKPSLVILSGEDGTTVSVAAIADGPWARMSYSIASPPDKFRSFASCIRL